MFAVDDLIRSRMQDALSKGLFDVRLRYSMHRDYDRFLRELDPWIQGLPFVCYELRSRLQTLDTRDVILYGEEKEIRRNRRVLDYSGLHAAACCFSGEAPGQAGDLPVIRIDEMNTPAFSHALVLTTSFQNRERDRMTLERAGVDPERICGVESGLNETAASLPMQYFDVFRPGPSEVFLDAGAYDGQSSLDFLRWCGGRYRKIICLEPMEESLKLLRRRLAGTENVDIYPYAAWNRKETLQFHEDGSGSAAGSGGSLRVQGIRLDELVQEPVTFLKMDVEGSERKALLGASRLIRKYRPRMAISIYHKKQDVLSIPLTLLRLVPEYRFWIRQYSPGLLEAVLYASTEAYPL